ncbi:unnamed protein product [Rotaria sp. Silwood1]|nr:unnamed protein product [Rotaria sp. Silwood1]CAF3830871.1 unnamed protein product [Rotaria sp. Silwood1]CAF4758979.1 unnamed protein product [Rotaria sp. Silwood1]
MIENKISTKMPVYYRSVGSLSTYQSSIIPRERNTILNANQVVYRNIINDVKQVIDRRSPCQHEQILKPSQIDPKLKHIYTKRS